MESYTSRNWSGQEAEHHKFVSDLNAFGFMFQCMEWQTSLLKHKDNRIELTVKIVDTNGEKIKHLFLCEESEHWLEDTSINWQWTVFKESNKNIFTLFWEFEIADITSPIPDMIGNIVMSVILKERDSS